MAVRPPPERPAQATYVFCVVRSARPPSLRGVPGTLPGAGPPRLISVDRDMWAVVADAPLERFGSVQLQNDLQDLETVSRHALAHASVNEFFFRRAQHIIPLKLFTLFSADERAREHLRRRLGRLRRLFANLKGLEEWGVRIVSRVSDGESDGSWSSGRDYLEMKRRLKHSTRVPARAAAEGNSALKTLGGLASKVRKETFPTAGRGTPVVTGASFLVETKRRRQWIKEVAKVTDALAARGHRLEMSGPWPPYHFVSK